MNRQNINNVTSITFWKRHPSNMMETDSIEFTRQDDGTFNITSHDKFVRKAILGEFEKIFTTLFYEYGSMFEDEQYLGYLYENNPENFMLRFSLIIRFDNSTYLYYKGIDIEQPHYDDILNLFKPLLLEIDNSSYRN